MTIRAFSETCAKIRRVIGSQFLCCGLAIAFCVLPAWVASAQSAKTGPSGLPLPRFVSLKSSKVNVRMGPGQDYEVAWVYVRSGLPVEIIQEFDNWRKIRDSEGEEGWIFHSLLSGQRTAILTPWAQGERHEVRATPELNSAVRAYLEAGVVTEVTSCSQKKCEVSGDNYSGWIGQDLLWGVYPDEEFSN